MPCTPERVWRAIETARGAPQDEAAQHQARQADLTQGNSPQRNRVRNHRPERRNGMIPASFDYVRPASLDEAVSALADGGDDAKIIAVASP